ncbi:MAG: DUF4234 domain-containing protein [Thermoplasmatota archaeon]
MVLPMKVGKQRSFSRGLLLTVVTFGIYGIYWNYKAHNEVFEQFELKKEGRDENIILLILGLVIFQPLYWFYQYRAVENDNYVRSRLGLPVIFTAGAFLLWEIVPFAMLLALAVPIIVFGVVAGGLGRGVLGGTFALLGLLAVAAMVSAAVGYAKLQESLNGIWDRYDQRALELAAQGVAPAAPPPLM